LPNVRLVVGSNARFARAKPRDDAGRTIGRLCDDVSSKGTIYPHISVSLAEKCKAWCSGDEARTIPADDEKGPSLRLNFLCKFDV
jgi:hypothetical protein